MTVRLYDGGNDSLWEAYLDFDPGRVGPYVPRTHNPVPGDEPPVWRNVDSVYVDDVPFTREIWQEVYFS